MEPIRIFKTLSNENRLRILQWLTEPTRHFPPQQEEDIEEVGVCVDSIRRKLEVSQSTTSQYLSKLEDAGLITSQRIGQWTYYQRDEETIKEFARFVRDKL
ncbi:ArsR family transcriptional regulator [Halostagnicola sp. A56]|nr:ArsR family transcriptional regulator [Halostagnicola sp. A56]